MSELCGFCQKPVTDDTGTVDGKPVHFRCWLDDIEREAGPWRPGWYYNKYGNCAHVIWKEPKRGETAEYLNNAITLMRDDETGEVIGVMIKNVSQVLEGKDCNDFHRAD